MRTNRHRQTDNVKNKAVRPLVETNNLTQKNSACEPSDKYLYFEKSAPNAFVIEDANTPADVTFEKDDYDEGHAWKNGWIYRGEGMKNPKQCAMFCASVPNCKAWSALRYYPGGKAWGGCKIFSSKDGYSTDLEVYKMANFWVGANHHFWYESHMKTPMWISGERGCYGESF